MERETEKRESERKEEWKKAWSEFSLPLSHLYSIEHHYQLSPFITHALSLSRVHVHTHKLEIRKICSQPAECYAFLGQII